MYDYKAIVTKVKDGDTFVGTVKLGFKVSMDLTFRVLNLDTPETRRAKGGRTEKRHGKQATQRAKELLLGQKVIINSTGKGKFGRWLADVTLTDGRDYATVMKNEGFEKKSPKEYNNIEKGKIK